MGGDGGVVRWHLDAFPDSGCRAGVGPAGDGRRGQRRMADHLLRVRPRQRARLVGAVPGGQRGGGRVHGGLHRPVRPGRCLRACISGALGEGRGGVQRRYAATRCRGHRSPIRLVAGPGSPLGRDPGAGSGQPERRCPHHPCQVGSLRPPVGTGGPPGCRPGGFRGAVRVRPHPGRPHCDPPRLADGETRPQPPLTAPGQRKPSTAARPSSTTRRPVASRPRAPLSRSHRAHRGGDRVVPGSYDERVTVQPLGCTIAFFGEVSDGSCAVDPHVAPCRGCTGTVRRSAGVHFPADRNSLTAHVTAFHALPGRLLDAVVADVRASAPSGRVTASVTGVRLMGRGVAYDLSVPQAEAVRAGLARRWHPELTSQDRQGWRPHVTVQNKVAPEVGARFVRAPVGRLRALQRPGNRMGTVPLPRRPMGARDERAIPADKRLTDRSPRRHPFP